MKLFWSRFNVCQHSKSLQLEDREGRNPLFANWQQLPEAAEEIGQNKHKDKQCDDHLTLLKRQICTIALKFTSRCHPQFLHCARRNHIKASARAQVLLTVNASPDSPSVLSVHVPWEKLPHFSIAPFLTSRLMDM